MALLPSIECIGRFVWRELHREWRCRQHVGFQAEPVPSLEIRWVPKNSARTVPNFSFAGNPQTCRIHPSVFLEGCGPVALGDRVTIQKGVVLATSSHQFKKGGFLMGLVEVRPIVIEDDVQIGEGSIVCGGVRLGCGCRIEPDSVVSFSIEAGATAGGVPAKPHLSNRLESTAVLSPLVNLLGARTYLTSTGHLIRKFFGAQIRIGADTFFHREVSIAGCGRLRIGDRVFVAPRVEFDLSDASDESVIENDVWIGAGVKLTAPFHIRAKSILAAGCHFAGNNKRSGVWGGRPAYLIHHDTATAHLIQH